MIAHIAGVPVEETLLPLMSGMGPGLLLAGAWVAARVRRPGRSQDEGNQHPGSSPVRRVLRRKSF
jgi:hypothetical protein